jgi:ADP-L-glycero-D-manno-heptose 6-epimerase
MIVVTGAAGFIGSYLVGHLNRLGLDEVLAVDDFGRADKIKNLNLKRLIGLVHRSDFPEWLVKNHRSVGHIFHLGARTDTAEIDQTIFDDLNLNYTKKIWSICTEYRIPVTYASSAATYGDGTQGYNDDLDSIDNLRPLNLYGESKNNFDIWAIRQKTCPPHWHGLKFFNVYGPNEYHKGRMASVIMHAYRQIKDSGRVRLFRSHRPDVADGQQSRDFVYVKDIAEICVYCMLRLPANGLYNAGTGKARSFLDLVQATFKTMDKQPQIDFIDTPIDIREKYQYFTEANMRKLIESGYGRSFTSLEDGVDEYVSRFLKHQHYA